MPVRNVNTVGACMSLDIAPGCIAVGGDAVAAGAVVVAAAAPPEPGFVSEAMQSGKPSKSWGLQRITETMTNPTAISVDLNKPRNVNLGELNAIFQRLVM
jgi:hypothetical protein